MKAFSNFRNDKLNLLTKYVERIGQSQPISNLAIYVSTVEIRFKMASIILLTSVLTHP